MNPDVPFGAGWFPLVPSASVRNVPVEAEAGGVRWVAYRPADGESAAVVGARCPHLTADNLCGIYDRRPEICRSYRADDLCARIAAPTLDERVRNYLAEFGLLGEAAAAASARSMRAARSLPVLR